MNLREWIKHWKYKLYNNPDYSLKLTILIIIIFLGIIALFRFKLSENNLMPIVKMGNPIIHNSPPKKGDFDFLENILTTAFNIEKIISDSLVNEVFNETDSLSWYYRERHINYAYIRYWDSFVKRLIAKLDDIENLIVVYSELKTRNLELSLYYKDILTHKLKMTSPAAKLAIIIDDVGYNVSRLKQFWDFDAPLTFSILPNTFYADTCAKLAHSKGYQIMLHLPMESYSNRKAEPKTLLTSMTAEEIRTIIRDDLEDVPYAIGVNNHTGSKFTAYTPGMRIVLDELKKRNLFFIDSLTSPKLVPYKIAKEIQMPIAINFYFLDNDNHYKAIKRSIDILTSVALQRGQIIGIGHCRTPTAKTLIKMLPEIRKKGVELVYVSELVSIPQADTLLVNNK